MGVARLNANRWAAGQGGRPSVFRVHRITEANARGAGAGCAALIQALVVRSAGVVRARTKGLLCWRVVAS